MSMALAGNRIEGTPLRRPQIGGRLSLVDRGPLAIAAEQDLIVYVCTGAVWATPPDGAQSRLVRAGEFVIADRAGPLVVRAVERGEVELVWPLPANERLSPGLEPISIEHELRRATEPRGARPAGLEPITARSRLGQ
jgi:hypothetical protein